MKVLEFNHSIILEDQALALEDAQEVVAAAFTSIQPEAIENNAQMKQYSFTYWNKIDEAEAAVAFLKGDAKEVSEGYREQLEAITTQIDLYKSRIAQLSRKE